MKLLEKILDRFRHKQEVAKTFADAPVEQGVPANREYIRGEANWQRRRGAGYTREMRKGRTMRHPRRTDA